MATCTPVNLPAVKADFCAPVIAFGEIDMIYLANAGNPFTDWTDITEWNNRLDNVDVVDATKVRSLHVIGDKPAPERTKVEFSQGRSAYTAPKHTVNAKVDEVSDENYALAKFLEDNPGQNYLIWYSAGGYLFGGNAGIDASFVLDHIIPESKTELQTLTGKIEWEGGHPERQVNPLA